MRNLIYVLACVIAGVTFCIAIANTTVDLLNPFDKHVNYLSSISNIGIFVTSLIASFYAVIQYENHKKEERTKLLCEYNQRYSSDKNIEEVVTWMLQVSILDDNGEIKSADPTRAHSPGIHKKEMFMRFFEELYLQIKNNKIDKRESCRLFSYYARKFDAIEEFRLDITDYIPVNEEDASKSDENKKKLLKYWSDYRKYVKEMNSEWESINNGSIID